MNIINETDINARFAELCRQRDAASNHAVNLTGALAMVNEHANAQTSQIASLNERIAELEAQLAEKTSGNDAPPEAQDEQNAPEVPHA